MVTASYIKFQVSSINITNGVENIKMQSLATTQNILANVHYDQECIISELALIIYDEKHVK